LWQQEFVTTDVTAVFVNNQRGIQQRGQDFDEKFVSEGVHSKQVVTYQTNSLRKAGQSVVLISC